MMALELADNDKYEVKEIIGTCLLLLRSLLWHSNRRS